MCVFCIKAGTQKINHHNKNIVCTFFFNNQHCLKMSGFVMLWALKFLIKLAIFCYSLAFFTNAFFTFIFKLTQAFWGVTCR